MLTTLKELLLKHVIGQVKTVSELPPSGYIKTLSKGNASATNTLSLHVKKSNRIVLNGVSVVIKENALARNGIEHVADYVYVINITKKLQYHLVSDNILSYQLA